MGNCESKPKNQRRRIQFRLTADPGSRVCVAGDFNNWNAENKVLKDPKGDGIFSGSVLLAPGTYEYKFVVNGIWSIDPQCAEWTQNSCGSLNSVLHVE